MPIRTYNGVGEVFAGADSLGRFRYQIDVATDPIAATRRNGHTSDLDEFGDTTGWLDIGHALHTFVPRAGEILHLQLETGEWCDFCITEITLTGSSAIPITLTSPLR